jgi:hypothetical protein
VKCLTVVRRKAYTLGMGSNVTSSNASKFSVFVQNMGEGYGITESAKRAGVPDPYSNGMVAKALEPATRKLIRSSVRGRVDIEASPIAYRFLLSVLQDNTVAKGLRVEVGKFFMSHSIAAPKAIEEDSGHEKNPSEMSNEELRRLVAASDEEMVKRRLLIDATPTQTIDDVI